MPSVDRGWLYQHLNRLAEAIVATVGPHCEVVVHDFRNLEHSAIVVAGNVTGRKPGAPVPDLGFISEGLDSGTPDQLNYRTRIGGHDLQSSTVWIRDIDGAPIGAVCINIDYSGLLRARELLDALAASTEHVSDFTVEDTFARDLDELIERAVGGFLREQGVLSCEMLGYEDRLRLIRRLEEHGLFKIRGAAGRVSELLGVSRASVYNYRSNVKQGTAEA